MTKKVMLMLEFVFCVLAVVIISIFGNNPENWRNFEPASSIEFTNAENQTNHFVIDEDGDKVVTLDWATSVTTFTYQLSWKILPKDATISKVELTSSLGNDITKIEISETGLITFKSRDALSGGCSVVISTTDKTNFHDTISFVLKAVGGDIPW